MNKSDLSASDRIIRTNAPAPTPLSAKARGEVLAVVLDWAGTIVDFGSCAPAAVFVQAFLHHGVTVTLAQARAPMGMAKRDHILAIASEPSVASQWRAAHSRDFAEADIDAIYATFLPLQEACVSTFSTLIPGAREAIRTLRDRRLKIGSSTGYTREIMAHVMREAAVQGLTVDAMYCASDVPQGRPWPWLIYTNMQHLCVCPPARVVIVDDTVVGIQAGLNAGVWTVAVAATGNLIGMNEAAFRALPASEQTKLIAAARRTLTEAGAHYVVDSIADLPAVVAHINES